MTVAKCIWEIINITSRKQKQRHLEAFKNERNDFSKEDTSNQNEANENVNTYDSQKQQRREQRKLERLIENCEPKLKHLRMK